jgi:ABC-2 type transport system permease protein
MFKRALLVARREFSVTIRRKAYILTIFGTPIMLGVIYGIAILVAVKTEMKVEATAIAVVDSSGVLKEDVLQSLAENARQRGDLSDAEQLAVDERIDLITQGALAQTSERFIGYRGAVTLFTMSDADSAREISRRGDLDGALIIAGDYIASGRVWGYGRSEGIFDDEASPAERILRTALVRSMFADEDVDPQVQNRIMYPMNLREYELREAGETAGEFEQKGAGSVMRGFVLPYGFTILLLMSIFMTGGFLLQGVAEEKENRVIEILLSTVTPNELLTGKVIGLGAAGLLQILIWLGMAFGLISFASLRFFPEFSIPIGPFLYALPYFLLGYLMFASLMAGAGSLGNTQKESQQITTWFTLPAILPVFVFMPAILAEPNGMVARLLSYIPLTSPFTMMMRLPSEQVPWWEFPLTLGILALTTVFAIRLGAKLFRLGALMYGKRPNLPELWRWLREA